MHTRAITMLISSQRQLLLDGGIRQYNRNWHIKPNRERGVEHDNTLVTVIPAKLCRTGEYIVDICSL